MSEEIIRKILPWVIAMINPIFMGLNSIIIKKAFNDGMKYSVLLFYKNTLVAIGGLLILLFSKKSRSKITLQILPKIVALSILETGVDQNFLYLGMRYTPASLATCIIATTPILTFVVGLLFKYIRNRNERPIDIKERSTRAKLLGLAIVVGGAFVVGLYNGPTITTRSYVNNNKEVIAHKLRENLVRGPILIILAVIAVSIYNNLLKNTLPRAPLLLTTLTCSIGALINMVVAIALEGKSGASWMLGLNSKLLCYLYSGLVVSGLVSMLQNIGTNMKDAVSIAIFNPTSMIYVMVLSATWLKETIHLGSGLGAGVIIIGLSFYIWGVKHEPAVEES